VGTELVRDDAVSSAARAAGPATAAR
jgi:hypothetical protein